MSKAIDFAAIEQLLNKFPKPDAEEQGYGPSPILKLKILTLAEASFLSQASEQRLLHDGELGALTFFVLVPGGARVQLYNERTAEHGDPPLMRVPNILALDRDACTALRTWRRTHVSKAALGASFSATTRGDHLRQLTPGDCESDASGGDDGLRFQLRRWTHWKVTLPSGAPLEVDLDSVRVFEAAIKQRYGLNLLPRGTYEAVDPLGRREQRDNYKSDLLQYLNQAARIFWGPDRDTDDIAPYPQTAEIVKWLRAQDERFSASLAEAAASIIRPNHVPSTRLSKEAKVVRDPQRKRRSKPSSTFD